MTSNPKLSSNLKPIFVANWSPYLTIEQTEAILDKLIEDCKPAADSCYIAFPYSLSTELIKKYKGSGLILGCDSMLSMAEGSYTGSIAARMLKDASCNFVILDSRSAQELDTQIKAVIQEGITPFICIGESLKEYEQGQSAQVITHQLSEIVQNLTPPQILKTSILYEAPWIHSLPYPPTLEQLSEAYQRCLEILQNQLGPEMSKEIRLICTIPHDFEDLPALIKTGIQGLYLAKAGLFHDQLYRIFAPDLTLHQPEMIEEPFKEVHETKQTTEPTTEKTPEDIQIEQEFDALNLTPKVSEKDAIETEKTAEQIEYTEEYFEIVEQEEGGGEKEPPAEEQKKEISLEDDI